MRSDIEPFGNPIRVMIADACKLGKSVLDVGCASCISYPLFLAEGMDYVGMDFTLAFLRVAKKEYGNIVVAHGHALQLPFKDGAFDSVFIKDVLEHVGEDAFKTVIAEMWRVAKIQIIIALYGNLVEKTIYKQTREPDEHNAGVPPYKGGIYYFNFYGRQELLGVIDALPELQSRTVLDDLPLELTTAKSRTLIIARKVD